MVFRRWEAFRRREAARLRTFLTPKVIISVAVHQETSSNLRTKKTMTEDLVGR